MFHLSATAAGPIILAEDARNEPAILIGDAARQALVAPRSVTLRRAYREEGLACRYCGTGISLRESVGWIHTDSGFPECTAEEATCPACHGPILHTVDGEDHSHWVHTGGKPDQPAAHDIPTPVATLAESRLEWLDAVSVEIDERTRALTIEVTVFDRGPRPTPKELSMAIHEEENGDLLLEVPQPSRLLRVTPLSGGRYLL